MGLILCKYGIEYVEDPATFKRIPTCHRASYDSIIADDDYKSALKYADGSQRNIYEQEAKEIDRIQKEIIELSSKEEPYDVFICYKETDDTGSRTQDSVIANDIYYQLTQEGFKVFYAAITLEDKLGSAYEPCIFAALNSAKVMLAIGTKPEYFNAVWVKNEWSRYLKIMKKDRSKLLIPCYKNMDAYDLPDEFAHLQAQDMGKIGFINDVVRGIKKVVSRENSKSTPVVNVVNNTTTKPLLKRAFIFLEDGDWNSANEYCEKVLDIDPECAQAYLGKLMAELHIKKQEYLKNLNETFENNSNYSKVIRYATPELAVEIKGYIEHINTRNKRQAEEFEKEQKYNKALEYFNTNDVEQIKNAIAIFNSLSGYKDSDEKSMACNAKIEELKITEEQKKIENQRIAEEKRIKEIALKQKKKKIAFIISLTLILCVSIVLLYKFFINPYLKYNNAIEHIAEGNYKEACLILGDILSFKDSEELYNKHITTVMDEFDFKADIIATPEAVIGITKSGKILIESDETYAKNLEGKCNIIDAAGGHGYIALLKTDGTVELYGKSKSIKKLQQQTSSTAFSQWKNIIKIESGCSHLIGLKSDGTVVAIADNTYKKKVDVNKWENIIDISCGDYTSVGLKSDGTVVAVGNNEDSQCTNIKNINNAKHISASYYTVFGTTTRGELKYSGNNAEVMLADNGTLKNIKLTAAARDVFIALKEDGTIYAENLCDSTLGDYSSNNEIIKEISNWTNILDVSALYHNIIALKNDGTVVYGGFNWDGEKNFDVSDWKLF